MASRTEGDTTKDRLPGLLLAALVVLVLLAWGSTLVYLGVHFLYASPGESIQSL